ncbi:ethanolamine utilization protein EutP [Melghirimyces profundicolus]|uniref:Ethanolamine utilization protein EutP n=1 Tax=Melghirimyces profundicolus TaxID=1242148 RepID=A0A2T6C8L2_9BACL|nr:EutP/PduV family microcompartment system protein [Melghirimyces profundicolus]PTX64650.1 ethanolamine utilization protein EutP [Melghirimyces profundicolus]
MGKVMLIGAVGAGKSTLVNRLLDRKEESKKTQTLNYHDWIVDTPGEYLENPLYYKALMATVLEVTHILVVQDSTRKKATIPPGFTNGIPKTPIGVVTKADHPEADINWAQTQLRKAMPKGPVVITSSFNGKGIDELLNLLGIR